MVIFNSYVKLLEGKPAIISQRYFDGFPPTHVKAKIGDGGFLLP